MLLIQGTMTNGSPANAMQMRTPQYISAGLPSQYWVLVMTHSAGLQVSLKVHQRAILIDCRAV